MPCLSACRLSQAVKASVIRWSVVAVRIDPSVSEPNGVPVKGTRGLLVIDFDFDFDEAANKAAAVIKGRLDSDTLTVSADMLSDSISAQIRPGVQELYKKLQHRRCDTCGAITIADCPRCGRISTAQP